MKINVFINRPSLKSWVSKVFVIMRITLFLLCLGVYQLFAVDSYSQNAKINLNISDQSVKSVLSEIQNQSEFSFMFNSNIVDVERKVDIKAENEKVFEVLEKLFSGTDVAYTVVDRQIVLFPSNMLAEQQPAKSISGKVTDQGGASVPGASVVVKGTTTGVTTANDGSFTLILPEKAKTLTISFIGMKSQDVPIGPKSQYNVVLVEETIGLEEVVAVGYGTQKKANLTGSVVSIGGNELIKRPATNTASLLQGKVSGLQISSHSGKPGDESNTLRIRGIGTFSSAGSDPLVLINGIYGDMTNLDPNDIESVSVLKDASSSAIYGARAANGVILITTKKGKAQDVTVDYSGNVQVQSATRLPDLVTNSADYMQYWNEGRVRSGQQPYFNQTEIDAFRKNTNDPVNYPNFNWIDHVIHPALVNNHSVNIGGGTEKSTFNLSLGFFDQPGITSTYKFAKYNARLSVDTKVTDWLKVGGDIQFVKKDITRSNWDNGNVDYQMLAVYGAGPNYTPMMTLPDGTKGYVARYSTAIGEWTVRNPDAQDASGLQKDVRYNVVPQFYAEVNLLKNLTWYSKGALTYDETMYKNHEHAVNNYFFKDGSFAHNNSTWQLGVQDNWSTNMLTTFYSTLDYKKTVGNHNFNLLAGYNQEYSQYRQLSGSKITFPTIDLQELNAGSSLGQTAGGQMTEWAIRSYFGRLAYDYKGKYLFEANARYDGTSRIAPDTRWGFFPSLSAAWRVNQEDFMKKYDWLSNFKLRGSWGELGNQNVGTYPYQQVLSTTSYPFSGAYPGAYMTRLVDKTLKWETTTVTDFGTDINVKNGLFTLTFDWYNKVTDNILYSIPVPASVGLSAPTVNYGKMKNTGFDFEIGHGKTLGEFRYDITANFSHYKNEVLRILAPSYGNTTVQVGLPFNSFYMIEFDGIFQNQAEISAAPVHPFNPKPGDLKYKDANKDGKIDSKDRVVVPGAYPKFFYGGSLNLSWKNFDLSAFIQGVSGLKATTQGLNWGLVPYIQGSAPTKDFVAHRWTGEGSTNSQPAMYISGYAPVTGTTSTFWLLNASYCRLKNLQIGYTVPRNLYSKIGLKGLRIYVSGDNMFTITKWPGSDPEKANTGWFEAYPQIKTFTLGVKVKI